MDSEFLENSGAQSTPTSQFVTPMINLNTEIDYVALATLAAYTQEFIHKASSSVLPQQKPHSDHIQNTFRAHSELIQSSFRACK